MAQAFLPNNNIKLLRDSPSDKRMKAMVDDHIGAFMKFSKLAHSTIKFNAATQMDPKAHSEENKAPWLK